jgi:sugar fermentation stimulation protein A
MIEFLYQYPPLLPGTLIRRYKRFFAEIALESGEVITAHCPNTGPMTSIYYPGNKVYVSDSNNPSRKLRYTWELTEVYDPELTFVGVNTALPNRVVKLALMQKCIPELGEYETIQTEVPYGHDGKSRVDFLLQAADKQIYLEVKNTTWVQGNLALFPDTVTTRGQKHLRELIALLPSARAVMLYFINRRDCPHFTSGDRVDPVYGQLLREAIGLGLQVLPCRFDVSPLGIRYLGLAELKLE